MTDQELISGCLEGSRKHQRMLYDRFAAPRAEAEDILQDGFVTVFRNMATFKGQGALGGWIRKIMVNTALMQFRSNKNHRQNMELSAAEYYVGSDENIFAHISAQELMEMIQTLPAGCRIIFNLYAVEGFSHIEIAEKLEISVGTSKSQFSRARTLLVKKIAIEESKTNEKALW